MSPSSHPFVRAVVLNYNGGPLTQRCLDALAATKWPSEQLEIVLVDNGSSDGSAAAALGYRPDMRLVDNGRNLGFAGGNNAVLGEFDGVDYVALVNNDAEVDPDWLSPLVAALDGDPGAGAASPKILFAPRFSEITLRSESSPSRFGDPRPLGVWLSGIEVDGIDRWTDSQFVDGWWEFERTEKHGGWSRWAGPEARLRLPAGSQAALRLASDRRKELFIEGHDGQTALPVGTEPEWHQIALSDEAFDVINNAGNRLLPGGYGADRGYLEKDQGQRDQPGEVFGWCGAAVLLRAEYLKQVGLFDERLFLYYEDFDLSWRGRGQGWHYLYVPQSVVRHVHSATAVEGSELSSYFIERNRLLVLSKNAPPPMAVTAVWRYLLITASYIRRDVLGPVLRGQRPSTMIAVTRVRSFGGFLRLLPTELRERRRLRLRKTVPDDELIAWTERD